MHKHAERHVGRGTTVARFVAAALAVTLPIWAGCGDEAGSTPPVTGGADASFVADVVTADTSTTPIPPGCTPACAAGSICANGVCTAVSEAGPGTPKTCAEVLAGNAAAASGVYTIDPDGTGAAAPFAAYCDMVEDGGGWTLLITLETTAVTFPTIASWPTTVATVAGPPNATGMYKGTLAPFKDVREEVASGKVKAWGKAKTPAQLELLRNLYAHQARVGAAATFGDIPSCRLAYATATDDVVGCTHYPAADVNTDTVLGWMVDPSVTFDSHCWFARGNCCSMLGGSSLCLEAPNGVTGDTNGTTWARTWFR